MSKLVTIYGGSGFVGRYIARRMAKAGWRVRVAVRRPNEALHVRPYGAVGQVEPILCNIRNDASVRAALKGADAVINCVGTFDKGGKNNFDAVQTEGAGRIATIAAAEGVGRMVHISAIGADATSGSDYSRTKGLGEAAVLAAFPNAVILRPSVIFGSEDGFFNRFGGMTRMGPVLPVVGGNTRFQPVFVDDVMLAVVQRRRLVLNIPFFVASIMAAWFDFLSFCTGRLVRNQILTRDQVKGLRADNVVSDGARGLADLGIEPTSMESVLPEYLWRFRPSGQFAAIMDSAKNLRKART